MESSFNAEVIEVLSSSTAFGIGVRLIIPHPNTVAQGYITQPSQPDINFANHSSINIPGIVRAHDGLHFFGPAVPP